MLNLLNAPCRVQWGGHCTTAGVEDEACTKFIQALKQAKLEDIGGGMQVLRVGVPFPDDALDRQELLVRDFFGRLLQLASSVPKVLLTGVPGTGKSWWLWYVVYCLLQQRDPPVIVMESQHRDESRRCILIKDGVAYAGTVVAFSSYLQSKDTWCAWQ